MKKKKKKKKIKVRKTWEVKPIQKIIPNKKKDRKHKDIDYE